MLQLLFFLVQQFEPVALKHGLAEPIYFGCSDIFLFQPRRYLDCYICFIGVRSRHVRGRLLRDKKCVAISLDGQRALIST